MLSIVNCIKDKHDLWLVLVAAIICFLGSWAVMRIFRRGRSATGLEAVGWLFLTATAAGASIWATHFIGILAFDPGVPVSFDPVLTMGSLAVSMIGTFCGVMIAGMLPHAWAPTVGGALVGLAITAMHYVGMFAYLVDGAVHWDLRFLLTSVVLAVVISASAFHAAAHDFRFNTRLTSTALLAAAIVSLHFTGMTALEITPHTGADAPVDSTAMQAMAIAVAMMTMIIIGAVLASYLIDTQNRAQALDQLEKMALSDSLTGLANRASYNDHLGMRAKLADNGGQKFALAAIDLDRFKEINDIHGHSAGDEALQILAQRMRDFNDGSLFIARVGGDEFSLIVTADNRNDLRKLLMRLRAELLKPFEVAGTTLSVGASIGVCIYPDDAASTQALVNNTDLALYRAKTEITDKICFFDNVMDEAVRSRRELAAELRQAMENDQLEVYYQVQTRVSDSSVTGYEALLRWNHPMRGFIPPCEFIPLAEESGLILQLGEWALRTACQQAPKLGDNIKIAVNLSPIQFLHPNLPGMVSDILAETGMPPQRLELELTESAIIHDKERTLRQLEAIRAMGVSIALDDFGTGYSSLDTLRAFPFDKIKLDRTFMTELATSQQARSIIRAVLALGKSLNIPVLAEGIETEDQLSILHEEGCDAVQGYLLGRPAPLTDIVKKRGLAGKKSPVDPAAAA